MNLISTYFTREEIERSDTAKRLGIDNKMTPDLIHNWSTACVWLFDEIVTKAIEQKIIEKSADFFVSSGHRCDDLNTAIHGSANSAHRGHVMIHGKQYPSAALDIDLDVTGFNNYKLMGLIRGQFDGKFDQLIWEHGWVHIGYILDMPPRGQVLELLPNGSYKTLNP